MTLNEKLAQSLQLETSSQEAYERLAQDLDRLTIADEHLRDALLGQCFLAFDGAMGTMLQAHGLTEHGEVPDLLNFSHPEIITEIHQSFVDAGAEVVTTNTFGANRLKLKDTVSVSEVYKAAVANARKANPRYIAGDIGPTGSLLSPLGTLTFDEVYDVFAEQVQAIVEAGCDLILIETQTDIREAKAAVLAAQAYSSLPVFVSLSFGEDGRTFMGTPPEVAAITFSALHVQAIGLNCSLGPNKLLTIAESMAPWVRCPLLISPNAGMPKVIDGKTVFELEASEFGKAMIPFIETGATILGGCCGTTPEHIYELHKQIQNSIPHSACLTNDAHAFLTLASPTKALTLNPLSYDLAIVGENINPTRRKKLKEALLAQDSDYVLGEALAEQEAEADIIDVNVGVPGIDEAAVMDALVEKLQASLQSVLQIDSSDPSAIAIACKHYGGKPIINSVNGKEESLEAVLPIARTYGAAVIGLTLDENGIPSTAEDRLAVARKIVERAVSLGIPRTDIAIDCLVMTAATNQAEVKEIFRAMKLVKQELGVATVLGVSNVSFGLPDRPLINATFLAAAVGAGLNMPIVNPCLPIYRDALMSLRVLNGQDAGSERFIEYSASKPELATPTSSATLQTTHAAPVANTHSQAFALPNNPQLQAYETEINQLASHILQGRNDAVAHLSSTLIKSINPLILINDVFIPVLDEVGQRYESGKSFLPQLIASAEAAKAGFDVIKAAASENTDGISDKNSESTKNRRIIMATVQGDIHDIGKNIVAMLLENYGFEVIDLGFDVAPETILASAREHEVKLIGLSALMTTTVKAMEKTIELVHRELPDTAVMVGGAVLTPDYAASINADFYTKDAAEAARVATDYFSQQ